MHTTDKAATLAHYQAQAGLATSAHTPGPWVWNGNTLRPANPDPRDSSVHSILDAEGGYGFLGSDNRATLRELDADRRLIAAAPSLLYALQVSLDRLTVCCPDAAFTLGTARAAIAEATLPATGESA